MILSTINPSTVGQPVTFTATVMVDMPGSGMPTGMVDFYDDATLIGSAPLATGFASIITSADNDFQPTSGILTFGPGGPLSQVITVQVMGDTTVEPDETFTVNLGGLRTAWPTPLSKRPPLTRPVGSLGRRRPQLSPRYRATGTTLQGS